MHLLLLAHAPKSFPQLHCPDTFEEKTETLKPRERGMYALLQQAIWTHTLTRKPSLSTMNNMRPRLVIAEIMLVEKRCPVPAMTGVSTARTPASAGLDGPDPSPISSAQ